MALYRRNAMKIQKSILLHDVRNFEFFLSGLPSKFLVNVFIFTEKILKWQLLFLYSVNEIHLIMTFSVRNIVKIFQKLRLEVYSGYEIEAF